MKKLELFLSEMDFASDVMAAYAGLREEMPVSKAVSELKREFAEERQDEDDAPLFWLGLAAAMAESRELTKAVEEKAVSYLSDAAFIARYGEIAGFTPDDVGEIKTYFASSIGKAKRAPRAKAPYRAETSRKVGETAGFTPDYVNEIMTYFASSTDKAKKAPGAKAPYRAETSWKVGEVYAYPLKSETAQEYGVTGRFLLFHVLETGVLNNCLVPAVHVYITRDEKLPKTGQELSECNIIPYYWHVSPPHLRYIITSDHLRNFERNKNIFSLGKFDGVILPEERIPKIFALYGILFWENIEAPLETAQELGLI